MNNWILVVDDDTSNLKMAGHILGSAQMRVSCLKSGEDAAQFLQENKPDFILLDIHMPEMDGFQTMMAIRDNKAAADIPVMGARILKNIKDFPKLITGARWHHERYDPVFDS